LNDHVYTITERMPCAMCPRGREPRFDGGGRATDPGPAQGLLQRGAGSGDGGAILHRLFHRAFSVAKRVRTETGIASRAVSVSSVAVDLARRIFDRFDDKTVMLIGAGKMGGLMARHLQSNGARSLMVTNRTFDRAVELAGSIHGSPILFEDFPRYLKIADLVIGCTGAQEVLIDAAAVGAILKERKHKPMFFIDIGDRRNFDAEINELDNAYLYNIDDLQAVANENLQERSNEAEGRGSSSKRWRIHPLDPFAGTGADDHGIAPAPRNSPQ
jgi:glutamyl-tRNA reductase